VFAAADLAVRTSLLHATNQEVVGFWFGLLLISAQFIGLLVGAMSYVTAPMAARALARADSAAIRTVLDDSLRLALIVTLPVLAAIVALRRPLISVLFSADFAPMARYVPFMMVGDAMRVVAWTLGVALVPLGLTRTWIVTAVGASVAFGVVGVVGAYTWGLAGAVGAWSTLWFVSAIGTAGVLVVRRLWRPSRHAMAALLYGPIALGGATVWPGTRGLGIAVLSLVLLAGFAVRTSEREAILTQFRALSALRTRA
jgi:O-antigen/teichoic acid export membrane protein